MERTATTAVRSGKVLAQLSPIPFHLALDRPNVGEQSCSGIAAGKANTAFAGLCFFPKGPELTLL